MILGYTADAVRTAEEPLLAEGAPLMERAAFALATEVLGLLRERRGRVVGAGAVLLVGGGNNGGDALHAGAVLARRGVGVRAVLTTPRPHAAGLAALRAAGGTAVSVAGTVTGADDEVETDVENVWMGDAVAEAYSADVVLDGLLGIGARGAPRGPAGELVALLAELLADEGEGGPLVVAVDVPSGIGVDDGTVPDDAPGPASQAPAAGAVLRADVTVTFGAAKAGLLLPPASALAGRVHLVELGLDLDGATPAVARLESTDLVALWPAPAREAHKYSRGVVGVVAGTAAYPGAAVLAVTSAALSGAGMVRYVGPPAVTQAVIGARPEVVAGTGRVQAWVLGPGVDPSDAEQAAHVADALEEATAHGIPAVVDAGALSLLPDRSPSWVVLTPHAGELATLLGRRGVDVTRAEVERRPLHWAQRAHELTGATVLLKGSTTVVAGAAGAVYAQADAPAWLATAGAGDVLAGLLGVLLAGRADDATDPQVVAALAAAAAAVHGRAGARANPGGPITALAVAHAVPGVVAELLGGRRHG